MSNEFDVIVRRRIESILGRAPNEDEVIAGPFLVARDDLLAQPDAAPAVRSLVAEVEGLRREVEVLRRYAKHRSDCDLERIYEVPESDCTCGLDEQLAAVRAPLTIEIHEMHEANQTPKIEDHPGAIGMCSALTEQSLEWLRLWKTEDDRIVVMLRISDRDREPIRPGRWGAWLHDIAKNVATAYADHLSDDEGKHPPYAEVLTEIVDGFLDEHDDPVEVRAYDPSPS